ncbi:MAG: ABC transporter permease [Rhodobacteraceae bacterium]|nr:ABC transporter permease [Paracoccaceae bacterium]
MSHWRRQPLQLVILGLGLALATALWSAVQAINAEARASYSQASEQLAAGTGAVIDRPGSDIAVETYARMRRAGWDVAPVLQGRIAVAGRQLTVVGIDVLTHPAAAVILGDTADLSESVTGEGRLFARPDLQTALATTPGLPPIVSNPAIPPGEVWTDLSVAERLLNRAGRLSHVLVLQSDHEALEPESFASGLRLRPEGSQDTAQLTRSFHLNLTAFGFLAFGVGLFIVHGAIGLAFEQRRTLFRTLRALGVPLQKLVLVLSFELLGLAVFAGAAGLVLGHVLAAALLPDVAATLRGLYGAPVEGALGFRWHWAVAGLSMAVGGAVVAGASALVKLRHLPILAGSTVSVWAEVGRVGIRRQAMGGVFLAALGALVFVVADGLVAGFALLAGLLLGAALCLPLCLAGVLKLGQVVARGPVAQWVWADARAQLPGLSLALMALMLALATNVGVSTMVSSFRLTFTGWLDQRLAAEIYVTARDDTQGAEITSWLAPRVQAVLPIRSATDQLNGQSATIFGIIDHQTYRLNWPLLDAVPDVWARVAKGQGVLINEQMALRQDVSLDDILPFAGQSLPVVGVYSDYGNPRPQAIVGMDLLLSLYGDVPNYRFAIRIPAQEVDALRAAIAERFDLPPGGVRANTEVKQFSKAVFENTFVVTGALNALTLGVAGFAILTSLLTLWTGRLPQIAPVWSMGLTRKTIAMVELVRSLLLAAFTALVAVPVGLGLAWVLLNVINVEAFGWRLPMFLFPADWAILAGLALFAAALAAGWPSWRMARVTPAELLKVFANDR